MEAIPMEDGEEDIDVEIFLREHLGNIPVEEVENLHQALPLSSYPLAYQSQILGLIDRAKKDPDNIVKLLFEFSETFFMPNKMWKLIGG